MLNAASRCLLLAVAVLGGCSTTPDRQIPAVELQAAAAPAAMAPSLSFTLAAWQDEAGTAAASAAVASQVKLELIEVLQLSNRFGRISDTAADADIRLQLTYKEYSTPGARLSAFVTAISLSLIPSSETTYIEVGVTATAADGKARSYELADSVTQKRGLPAASGSAAGEVLAIKPQLRKNIFRTLVNNMVSDGFFTGR